MLVVAVLSLAAVYAIDDLRIRFRLRGAEAGGALGTVTFYSAILRKDGRVEVFWDQPQTETCVQSLFPHAGYRPCWYARRRPVRTIG